MKSYEEVYGKALEETGCGVKCHPPYMGYFQRV